MKALSVRFYSGSGDLRDIVSIETLVVLHLTVVGEADTQLTCEGPLGMAKSLTDIP